MTCTKAACESSLLKKRLYRGAPITALIVVGYAGMQGWQLMQGRIDPSTLKRRLAVATAAAVGGWLGSSVGAAIGGRLPLIPRRIGHFVGGALGGYLGTKTFINAARKRIGDCPQPT
jgi:hypothetical protein